MPRPAAPAHAGNDLFRKLTVPKQRRKLAVSYWDVWFLLVLLTDCGGDWDGLAAQLRRAHPSLSGRDTVEAMLSHLRALQRTLAEAHLTPEAVLGEDGPTLLRTEIRRARKAIFEKPPAEYAKSEWMIHTPRRQLEARARRGYWPQFPVSPEPYAEAIARQFKPRGWYEEDESFGLQRKLSNFLDRLERGTDLAQELALYRAFLTVMLEKLDMVDDSYGVIGDLYAEVFRHYAQLHAPAAGLPLELFYQDWLELALWEDVGFLADELPVLFAKLDAPAAALVAGLLPRLEAELRLADLEHQAEEALTLRGLLCTQQRWFDQFVDLARQMGTREAGRIQSMSALAEKRRRYPLALAVYEACWGPGLYEPHLRQQYAELQARLEKIKRRPSRSAKTKP